MIVVFAGIIPGKDPELDNIGNIRLLGEILPPNHGKAEGLVVVQEESALYHLIIVYDGVKSNDKIMQRFILNK